MGHSVGQIMRTANQRANPEMVRRILQKQSMRWADRVWARMRGVVRLHLASLVVLLSLGAQSVDAQEERRVARPPAAEPRELVVLVHGLGRTPLSMLPLEWALEREGYRVLNWGYSSVSASLPELGAALAAQVSQEIAESAPTRVHWVGHSLGGILARWALAHHPELRGGRVIMLAPPNQGSASADRYAPIVGRILQPLDDLRTEPASAVRTIAPPTGVDVGIIAGASDGKVSVDETHLTGIVDHVVMPGYHTFLMAQPSVQKEIVRFLRTGRFGAALTRPEADRRSRRGVS
jgi:pimeloyl-ACP methyl ester carboxylesterase